MSGADSLRTAERAVPAAVAWASLSPEERRRLLERPALRDDGDLRAEVRAIVARVRDEGDRALADLTRRLDGAEPGEFRVSEAEFEAAERSLGAAALRAIDVAIGNLTRFHEAQRPAPVVVDVQPGVRCERVSHPIESVGLYVPAGSAPLPSTALMLCVPARIAACPLRIVCTPPRRDGRADAAVLAACRRAGTDTVFKLGGAQAVAAMAYGTETVPAVARIFGPGNAWVTAAKALVAADPAGAAIDMPAGPSEVLVIADETADADFVAADLLSQAEHGADSQVLLVATGRAIADAVITAVERQLAGLTRREVASSSVANGVFIVADSLEEAVDISNRYAPEHLIVQTARPRELLPSIRNAGSVFLGPWSPESAGDYCSGTNHVLPTYGAAKSYSGLSVDHFLRQMTIQELDRDGLEALAPSIITLAELEGLDAHAEAVRRRVGQPPP